VLAGRVTRVIDGDTLDVLLSSGRIRVRLHGIDAPEHNQAGGPAATQWLTARVLNQDVLLEPVSQDRYDRLLAVVYLQDSNVNRELVSAGQAWAYRRYLRRSDRDLCNLESSARDQKRGLWSSDVVRAPWEFRATLGKGLFTNFSGSSAADCRKAVRRR
jgi:micrococcal nuclease